MQHDKKRSSLSENTIDPSHFQLNGKRPTSSTSHAYASRHPISRTGATSFRTESPPASSYFSQFQNDGNNCEQPMQSPDADSHFAYSTTLRRHHSEGISDVMGFVNPPYGTSTSSPADDSLLYRTLRAFGAERWLQRADNESPSERRASPAEETPSSKFASLTVDETLAHFRTDPSRGLSSSIVPSLRSQYGYNEFSVAPSASLIIKFAQTIYESPLILLLLGSAFISAVMGNVDDAVSIAVAIFIVLTVGFVQERRSEKSLEALNKLVPHHCHLIRDGHSSTLLANDLVPGDLVTFSVGDRIPADVRLLSSISLEIDESSLTGETHAAEKGVEKCEMRRAPLGDRKCVAFMGTLVRNGRGSGIVVATGTQTEFGVIFSMMQDVEEKRTPLQNSMDELAKKLSTLSFGVIGVICMIGVWQQRSWLEMFTIGVSLAVAAIPEGLPIVTTVTLALGVLRMARRKAIVKKLPSVEALGSISVICSDKTGTLTKNEQTVTEAYVVDEVIHIDTNPTSISLSPAFLKTFQIGAICNNAFRNEQGVHVGQSTDVALLNVLTIIGLSDQNMTFKRTSEQPFNSEQKYMAVSGVHVNGFTDTAREIYYIKGSIETVLARCKFYYVSDESTPGLDAPTRSIITNKADSIAALGLRVVAMAYGYGSVESQNNGASANLIFVGFQAMMDPPRKGVSDSIALLQSGGVQVVMITGDAEQTALSIARQLGLLVGSGSSGCLTGRQMDEMDDRTLRDKVGGVCVFARTTPRHKMRIVAAYQSRGAVVAMTGDGVNDAPALKMADIGVSMGKSGTDVAKEAADVILVDDNFGTILSAVEEGKSIFHNIQNFLAFQLSTAVAALTLITLSTAFKLSNPLNAMQILFINILMDGPPSQSLGVDPADRAVMRRPPRPKDASIVTKALLIRVLFSATVIVTGTLFVYAYELSDGRMSRRDQTMTFTCFVFLDLSSALQNRGLNCNLTANRMLLTTISISFIVQLGLVYVPFLQAIFQTEALSWSDLVTLLMLGAVSLGVHEIRRGWERKKEASAGGMMDELV